MANDFKQHLIDKEIRKYPNQKFLTRKVKLAPLAIEACSVGNRSLLRWQSKLAPLAIEAYFIDNRSLLR